MIYSLQVCGGILENALYVDAVTMKEQTPWCELSVSCTFFFFFFELSVSCTLNKSETMSINDSPKFVKVKGRLEDFQHKQQICWMKYRKVFFYRNLAGRMKPSN